MLQMKYKSVRSSENKRTDDEGDGIGCTQTRHMVNENKGKPAMLSALKHATSEIQESERSSEN